MNEYCLLLVQVFKLRITTEISRLAIGFITISCFAILSHVMFSCL